MERFFLALTLTLLFHSDAHAGGPRWGFASLFRTIPIEEAHVIIGDAYDRDFDPSSIKVFIWNIKKTQERGWREEFLQFGTNQDLILIQEAYQNAIFNSTLETFTGYRWDIGVSFLYRKDNDTATGTMIGSNVVPTEIVVKHSVDYEPIIRTPKALTFAKYPIEGRSEELLAISIHGINITSLGSFKRHIIQAKEEILKHSGPVVFGGDFNTRTKNRMSFLFEMMDELGFKEVEFKNGHRRMKFFGTPHYLDHCFVRGLNVSNAEVFGDARGSDHKPMVLEVSVPEVIQMAQN
jgi:endonuclease/exonuclease/phosphatase (EEP) superfamily protein YafD